MFLCRNTSILVFIHTFSNRNGKKMRKNNKINPSQPTWKAWRSCNCSSGAGFQHATYIETVRRITEKYRITNKFYAKLHLSSSGARNREKYTEEDVENARRMQESTIWMSNGKRESCAHACQEAATLGVWWETNTTIYVCMYHLHTHMYLYTRKCSGGCKHQQMCPQHLAKHVNMLPVYVLLLCVASVNAAHYSCCTNACTHL